MMGGISLDENVLSCLNPCVIDVLIMIRMCDEFTCYDKFIFGSHSKSTT